MSFHVDPAWLWLIGGVVLLISLTFQLAIFAILALVAVRYAGRRFYASRYDHTPDPFLNDRARRMLGRVVVVVQTVDSHSGRVRVGDSEWSARGGPAAIGERVRIVDFEGNCLKVEPEHTLPPA